MARNGDLTRGLLDWLHADGCDEPAPERWVWPVVVPSDDPLYHDFERGADIEVIYAEACPQCGAVEWDVV